jgi:hypothetical protein
VQLTVVTGLTASRLDQLWHQCASWRGPLSASVYIVVKGDGKGGISENGQRRLAAAEADVDEFHKRWALGVGWGRGGWRRAPLEVDTVG